MYDFQKKLKSVLLMSTEKKLILAGGLWTGGAAKRDARLSIIGERVHALVSYV